jgi:hypothetical protein
MTPPDDNPKGQLLNSWKEIAACLGVTVRSAQRWEQTAGMPVYRQGTGNKARVFAYSEELLRWRDASGGPAEQPDPAAPPAARRWRLWYGLAAGLALALAAGGIAWRAGFFRRPVPADWAVERSVLTISDAAGKPLWQKRFPNLNPTYNTEPQDKVMIADIDGDGRKEVLFNHFTNNPAEANGSLFCFDDSGRLRWEARFGAPKTFGSRSFAQNFRGALLRLVTVDGKPRLLTVANHYIWYPSQVALLDPATGRVLEEYWHPGAIYHCLLRDLDGDGRDDVILGAINNPGTGLGHAALAVLAVPFSRAPRRPSASPDPFPPITGGGEVAYVLFPRPDVNTVRGVLPLIGEMGIDPMQRIVVRITMPEGVVVYYLDFKLNVLECRFSDGFTPLHNLLQHQGLLDHPLTGREMSTLGKVVRFSAAPDGNDPGLEKLWKF